MSSKLDQMRDQFRERLSSRPFTQTKVHVIKAENNDNNNNIDSKVAKSESSFTKNSIPTSRRNNSQIVSFDNQKSFNNLLKVSANKSNPYSVSPKTDSNSFKTKMDSNQEMAERSTYQWNNNTKQKRPQDFLNKRFSQSGQANRANTDGMTCRYCQRHFALSERLEKHETVCMSSLDKSRIKFNSFEQRVKGQPNDYLLIYENALKEWPKIEPKKSNWRQKHQYCIAAIKTAKGEVSSGPTTSQIMASIQQQCDYCKRRFNEEAIKRHLPICAKLHHKNLLKT